jgi:hypothetical protein
MNSFAMVKQFNVLKAFRSSVIPTLIVPVVNDLVLQRTQKAFSHRIVIAITLATHAAQHPVVFQQASIPACC